MNPAGFQALNLIVTQATFLSTKNKNNENLISERFPLSSPTKSHHNIIIPWDPVTISIS